MNLCVVLLLLAIQGLALSCCREQNDDLFSDEEPRKEDDWEERSGAENDFTGFESGSAANKKQHDDENARTFPRITRTYSKKSFVTSGDGEDQGGSKDDERSDSKSHSSKDQGSANEDFTSNMDLAKIGDAIDVMKRLKKAKSDEEMVKKLKSGPESLGVAFKTFEQLSGLWISVMHRIWRVWKAKGAKVVMHSIIDSLMNNTGKAITQKVGNFLSKKTVVDPANVSGSATFEDEGSTEPETSHSSNTTHNKTVGISVEKVSVDFIKNNTEKAKVQTEKAGPAAKTMKDTMENVKVSFTGEKVNASVLTQTSKHTSERMKNDSLVAKKTILDNTTKNATAESEKISKVVNSTSSVVSDAQSVTSLTKDSERSLKTDDEIVESGDYNKEAGNVSLGDSGNKVERNRDTERARQVTQHADKNSLQRKQANVTQASFHNQSEDDGEINSGSKPQNVDTQVQDTSSDVHSNSSKQILHTAVHHVNVNNSLANKNVTQERAVISEGTDNGNNTVKKSRVLENLKINFLGKKEGSHLGQNNNSDVSQQDALKRQRQSVSPLQNESNFETKAKAVLSKTAQLSASVKTGARLLDKVIVRLEKTDAKRNTTKDKHRAQRYKEQPSNKSFNSNATTLSLTSAKSENMVVDLNGKEKRTKGNKIDTFVSVASGTNIGHRNVTSDSSENDKNTNEMINISNGDVKAPLRGTEEKTSRGFDNSKISNVGSTQMRNNFVENSKKYLDKDEVKDKVQAENIDRVSDNLTASANGSVDLSNKKTSNDNYKIAKEKSNITKIDVNVPLRHTQKKQEDSSGKTKIPHAEKDPMKSNPAGNLKKSLGKGMETDKEQVVQSDRFSSNLRDSANISVELPAKTPNDKRDLIAKPKPREHVETLDPSTSGITGAEKAENAQKDVESHTTSGDNAEDEKANHIQKGSEPQNGAGAVRHGDVKKENLEKAKIDNKVITKATKTTEIHDEESNKENSSGNMEALNVDNKLKLVAESAKIDGSGSGSGVSPKENDLTRDPERHAANGQEGGVTIDTKNGLTNKKKGDRMYDLKSSVIYDPEDESNVIPKQNDSAKHSPQGEVAQNPKGVLIFGPESDVRHDPKSVLDNSSQVINITFEHSTRNSGSHKLTREPVKISSRTSEKKPGPVDLDDTKRYSSAPATAGKHVHNRKSGKPIGSKFAAQAAWKRKEEGRPRSLNSSHRQVAREEIASEDDKDEKKSHSSRTGIKPKNSTNEDIEPSKIQQVEVLTSRTPPTSLLTTSNDDNTYSIKEIVQGPRGSSLIYGHSDEKKIHILEKKVVKLENEVTVLESAMADLAKRLLVVEQKSVHPLPTMPTFLRPQIAKEVTPANQHPVHSQQQTTVYIGKDVTATPKIPVPQYTSEKIVIPISSLFPGAVRGVNTHSTSVNAVEDGPETKDDSRAEDKSQDGTHVALPLGAQSAPTSEAHVVVRPIVNIIVPNNRADLLSTGAICLPRCQNGGRCLDGNTCKCPTFFSGDYCERFSLRDLLESPQIRGRPNRKVQRVMVSESPHRKELDGTLRVEAGSPALEYRDLNLNQDFAPDNALVAKQQPVEITSPSNTANTEGVSRRRQLILEI